MKEKIRLLYLVIFVLMFQPNLRAQGDVTDFLKFGQENATTFVTSYLNPFGLSLGNNMNNGWFNTGQAHRVGRFDFRIGIPVTFVSEPARYFTFNESDFKGIVLKPGEDAEALVPTLFGDKQSGPTVVYNEQEIALPPGTGIGFFPVLPPSLQLNLGLIKDTELMFRYVPETNVRDFSTSMIGFGFKHGIRQYIPGIKHLPFDITVIMAWSKFNAGYGLDYNPQNDPAIDTDAQKLEISATAMNANLIVSKKLSVITFFGGFRYMNSNTRLTMAGDYPVASESGGTDIILTNPIAIGMSGSQVGLNAGFRLKLGLISFFADGTLAKYSSVNAGMSLGFHN